MPLRSLPCLALPCLAPLPLTLAQTLTLEPIAQDLTSPTAFAALPGDATRLLVGEKPGRVRILRDGTLLAQPFLDLTGQTESLLFESGLLDVAAHPGYAANGRFFVSYVDLDTRLVLDEFVVSSDPDVALPAAVQRIHAGPLPAFNHFAGALAFAPDGTLLLASGDGGERGAAQDLGDPRGKLLRFDVDAPAPFVPADNPFVGVPGALPEVWALGVRNPWRMAFDELTGDLWFGDVGEFEREELNVLPAGSGGGQNFGWPCFEGSLCTGFAGCDCGAAGFVPPAVELDHQGGPGHNAVVAGPVYRGDALPELSGRVLHADWVSGGVWSLDPSTGVSTELGLTVTHPQAFGVDHSGEVHLLVPGSGPGAGRVLKLVPGCGTTSYCSAKPNSSGVAGHVFSSGSTSLAAADFRLEAEGLVDGGFALFFYGPEQTAVPFGDGLRCVGPGALELFRLPPPLAVPTSGSVSFRPDLDAYPAGRGPGQWTAGSTWHFQCWYRDPASAAAFNLTEGLTARFCP